ncbi:hypothetical protein [Propionicicella superfundia]|uniref:hypothetical protein n=1 Tax=Propionicicella superfundia TaxID=348582 RepID=UPI000417E902|nr:hypothetical protein [Propionicicella superfundia]
MSRSWTGWRRLTAAAGSIIAVGALLTAAAITDRSDVDVVLDGSSNTFDIMVAGQAGTRTWTPAEDVWEQGDVEPFRIRLANGDTDIVMAPGSSLDVRVAAKNASPRLASHMTLTISDPQPRGSETDPATGNFVELYDQLLFTVRDGSTVLFDRVPAPDLTSYTWSHPVSSGDHLLLDVVIELPDSVDNRWQLASTDVQFHFEGTSA